MSLYAEFELKGEWLNWLSKHDLMPFSFIRSKTSVWYRNALTLLMAFELNEKTNVMMITWLKRFIDNTMGHRYHHNTTLDKRLIIISGHTTLGQSWLPDGCN